MKKDELGRPPVVIDDRFEKSLAQVGREKLISLMRTLLMANWILGGIVEETVGDHEPDCACEGCKWVANFGHLETGEPKGCSHMLGKECPFCDPSQIEELAARGDA